MAGIVILVWIGIGFYYFWPLKKQLPAPVILPPKIGTPSEIPLSLEDWAKLYQQAYDAGAIRLSSKPPSSEEGVLGGIGIRVFDLRSEEEYFSGHIRRASLILAQDLESLAMEGKLTQKTIIVLTNTGETQELKNLVKLIEQNSAQEVHLFADFESDYFPSEIIEKVEAPPPKVE